MVRFVSVGGILTTIAVILQSAPVFLSVIGMILSPFSTLPIALAAHSNISLGIAVYITSAMILTLVSVQEAVILIFTTGLLGIAIGTFLYRKGIFISILFSSILLSLGMILLTFVADISAFGDFTRPIPIPIIILIYILFSIIYSTIWNFCIRKLINYLLKIVTKHVQ